MPNGSTPQHDRYTCFYCTDPLCAPAMAHNMTRSWWQHYLNVRRPTKVRRRCGYFTSHATSILVTWRMSTKDLSNGGSTTQLRVGLLFCSPGRSVAPNAIVDTACGRCGGKRVQETETPRCFLGHTSSGPPVFSTPLSVWVRPSVWSCAPRLGAAMRTVVAHSQKNGFGTHRPRRATVSLTRAAHLPPPRMETVVCEGREGHAARRYSSTFARRMFLTSLSTESVQC